MMNHRKDSTPCLPRPPQPNHQQQEPAVKQEEETIMFAQKLYTNTKSSASTPSSSKSSSSTSSSASCSHTKIKTVICCLCGQQGHVSTVCPNKKPPEQIHAIDNTQDNASESSNNESVLILAQYADNIPPPHGDAILFAQDTSFMPRNPINSDLLLLDSQSTVHLFYQSDHVTIFCPVACLY